MEAPCTEPGRAASGIGRRLRAWGNWHTGHSGGTQAVKPGTLPQVTGLPRSGKEDGVPQRRHSRGNNSAISTNGLRDWTCLACGLGALDAWHPAPAALAAEIFAFTYQIVPHALKPEGRNPEWAARAGRDSQFAPASRVAGALPTRAAGCTPSG